MATREFPLVPMEVERIETRRRKIVTPIPVPESIPLLKQMRAAEPRSMGGQPPVIWESGEGCLIRDPYGNQWIDFSSGVLVTASGHGHPSIVSAIRKMADQGLYHAYCFPTDIRARLATRIADLLPEPLAKVFLLTTGSEAIECAIKLARTRGVAVGGPGKRVLITFENGEQVREKWDGQARWQPFEYLKPSRAVSVQVDPDRVLLLVTDQAVAAMYTARAT